MRPTPTARGPAQESVWDYPRPPRIEPTSRRIRVMLASVTIVDSRAAVRVLETSHPPVYYVPLEHVTPGVLVRTSRLTQCEWKGSAHYYAVTVGDRHEADAAWGYDDGGPLAGRIAFYAGRMDACLVDDERVTAQPGNFYGGWITSDIVGPFKGGPGSTGW